MTKCCFERKGLLGHRLTRKKTGSWDLQSKPPEAGLDGEKTDMSTVLVLMGLLCTVGSEKKDVSYLEEYTLAIDLGRGRRTRESSGIVFKKAVFAASGLAVGIVRWECS